MKNSILLFIILVMGFTASAQTANDILGRWQSAHGKGQIQIYKRGNLYFGKLVWLSEPNDESGKPKRDIKNPSQNLRTRPILGLEVLKDFTYKGGNMWSNGKVYDAKTGNTYNCQMALIDDNKLNIRAYFGLNILGKTETWTRIEDR